MSGLLQSQLKYLTRQQNDARKPHRQIKPTYFVRCKEHPEVGFQNWFETSAIYHKCACGQVCTVGSAHFPAGWEHLDKFEIILPTAQKIEWDEMWDDAQRRVEANPEKFKVEW